MCPIASSRAQLSTVTRVIKITQLYCISFVGARVATSALMCFCTQFVSPQCKRQSQVRRGRKIYDTPSRQIKPQFTIEIMRHSIIYAHNSYVFPTRLAVIEICREKFTYKWLREAFAASNSRRALESRPLATVKCWANLGESCEGGRGEEEGGREEEEAWDE